MQQAQLLRRRMAVMNNRVVGSTSSISSVPSLPPSSVGSGGGMSPSATPSPVPSMSGMGSPHPPGIGIKAGNQTPPANVLQVVKQVYLDLPHFYFICF